MSLGDVIKTSLESLGGHQDVDSLVSDLRRAHAEGSDVVVDLSECQGVYPNGVAPAAAAVQCFRDLGVRISFSGSTDFIERVSLRNPIQPRSDTLASYDRLNTLWVFFDEDDASLLASAFIKELQQRVDCQDGVLQALEWCLFEVMDNVCQHAGGEAGYAMSQLHYSSKRLAVCVADAGIGLHRSLASSQIHRPPTAFDALSMAIQEGVTKDDRTNQGNGLFGLTQIVQQNGGTMAIRSGRGVLKWYGGGFSGGNGYPVMHQDHHGSWVDFQLDVSRPVSLAEALNYDPVDLQLEALEDDRTGLHSVRIADYSGGTGTRRAAERFRHFVINLLGRGAPRVYVDFAGVSVISSSFADEVFGRLVADYGFLGFQQRFRVVNANMTVASLIDVAVQKRLAQSARG